MLGSSAGDYHEAHSSAVPVEVISKYGLFAPRFCQLAKTCLLNYGPNMPDLGQEKSHCPSILAPWNDNWRSKATESSLKKIHILL